MDLVQQVEQRGSGDFNRDSAIAQAARVEAQSEVIERQESALRDQYNQLALKCDATAIATFAPTVLDWERNRQAKAIGIKDPQHRCPQTITDLFFSELGNSGKAPTNEEVMQLLLNVAHGTLPASTLKKQAQHILAQSADYWAWMNS